MIPLPPDREGNRADLVDSSNLLGNVSMLRERAAEEGYLFFRGLLPVEAVERVRADLLRVVADFGWRPQDQPPLGGRINLKALSLVPESDMRADIGVSRECYHAVQKLESVHRLPHHPKLRSLYQDLLGGRVLAHPRHIVRMITAHPCMVPTPPHQDFPLIQGTANTWTAWIPIGDCPRSLGGLTVLRGSHRQGYVPITPAKGAGGIAAQLCPNETEWLGCNYHAGDVLTFPSYTIHKGSRCETKDQIRLSLDVRFQLADDEIEEKSLLSHCELSWDEIYRDWTHSDLKYYWRQTRMKLAPWQDKFLQPGRRIC